MQSFFDGVFGYLKAINWVFRRNIWPFALIPAFISVLFYFLLYKAVVNYSDSFSDWLLKIYPLEFGKTAVESMGSFIGGALLVVFGLIIYKYVILILSGPFMSPVSERIESIRNGSVHTHGLSLRNFIRDLTRAIRITIRNLFYELLLTLVLIILSFFPLFAPFTSIGMFVLSAYFAGFGNMDYTLERHFDMEGTGSFVRDNKFFAIGNGAVFILLLLIPVIGPILAVSLGSIGATLGTLDRL